MYLLVRAAILLFYPLVHQVRLFIRLRQEDFAGNAPAEVTRERVHEMVKYQLLSAAHEDVVIGY